MMQQAALRAQTDTLPPQRVSLAWVPGAACCSPGMSFISRGQAAARGRIAPHTQRAPDALHEGHGDVASPRLAARTSMRPSSPCPIHYSSSSSTSLLLCHPRTKPRRQESSHATSEACKVFPKKERGKKLLSLRLTAEEALITTPCIQRNCLESLSSPALLMLKKFEATTVLAQNLLLNSGISM